MSTRGFRFSKIHTSLLYLTGNYMEMWHNGEQASGATIAVGATVQRVRVSSHLPHLPPLLSSPLSLARSLASLSLHRKKKHYVRARILMLCCSEFAHTTPIAGLSLKAVPLLAKISCLTAEQPACKHWPDYHTGNTHTQL